MSTTALLAGCRGPAARAPHAPAAATRSLVGEAEGFERSRRYDLARERYQRALDTAPDPASAGFAATRFASALVFWGELEAARRMLEISVTRDPKRARAWHDLGLVRAELGDAGGGEHALRESVALAPADPRPRIALAALLVVGRRYAEAVAEYEALLAMELGEPRRRAVERALELLRAELAH